MPRRNNNRHNNGGKRVNPKVQTFDSNGPDVRVRGTAYQISDKYMSLAKDAASAGDAILAESYLQHAEHYQRFIAEMTEKFEAHKQNQRDRAKAENEAKQAVKTNDGEEQVGEVVEIIEAEEVSANDDAEAEEAKKPAPKKRAPAKRKPAAKKKEEAVEVEA